MIFTAGVDFGNSNCVVAIPKYDGAKVIMNQSSNQLTPTMVTYTEEKRYAGVLSFNNQIQNPQNTVTNLKRIINLPYDSQKREEISNSLLYNNLIKFNDGKVGIKISYQSKEIELRPEQSIAFLFKELKSLVFADELKKFVITVSPRWSEGQMRSIISCCKIAQIECLCLLKSSTASAIAYMMQNGQKLPKKNQKSDNICFIEIGESEMTVSVSEVKQETVHVKSFSSTEKVNGSILTQLFEKYLIQKVKEKFNIDPSEKVVDKINFRNAVEKTKMKLSIDNSCQFEFQSVGNVDVNFLVSRKEFNDLFSDVRNQIEPVVNEVLRMAKIGKNQVSDVVILGGSSSVVSFQMEIKRIFGKRPKQPPNFDLYGAIGCAYMAEFLNPKNPLQISLKDISQNSITAKWGENCEARIFAKFIEVPAIETIKVTVKNSLDIFLFNDDNEKVAKIVVITGIDEELKVTISFKLTHSCTTNVNNCFYLKDGQPVKVDYLTFYNSEFDEKELNEFIRIENELYKVDSKDRVLDRAKYEFKSQLEITNQMINKGLYDYIDPSIVGEVKEKITKIQEWSNETENRSLSPEEFNGHTCELKNITEPIVERMEVYRKSIGEITDLKNKAVDLQKKFENKVDPRILNFLTKFIQKISDTETTMKYKDVVFNVEKNRSALIQLENNLENMSKKK